MKIYIIKNNINCKVYIGSTKNFKERKRAHLKLLQRGKHHSTYLQNFFNRYKCELIFEIIEEVQKEEDLWSREFYWIKFYQSYNPKFGFNCSFNPRSSKGFNPIAQYSKEGDFIQVFPNIKSAEEYIKGKGLKWSHCPQNYTSVGGFQWKLCNIDDIPVRIGSVATYYCSYDMFGNLLNTQEDLIGIERKSNLIRAVSKNLTYNGRYWKKFKRREDILQKIEIGIKNTVAKRVEIFNKEEIYTFSSLTECSLFLKSSVYSLSRVLSKSEKLSRYKTIKGYNIKYIDS